MAAEDRKPQPLPPRRTLTRAKIAITMAVALTLTGTGIVLWHFSDRSPSLPESVKNRVEFTAFVPADLPTGYHIDESSYGFAEEALIFKVNVPDNKVILMSQQGEPGNFDISGFQETLKDKQTVETPYGTAYLGKSENNKVGSLVASGSWLFASTPPDTASEVLETIFKNLSKVED